MIVATNVIIIMTDVLPWLAGRTSDAFWRVAFLDSGLTPLHYQSIGSIPPLLNVSLLFCRSPPPCSPAVRNYSATWLIAWQPFFFFFLMDFHCDKLCIVKSSYMVSILTLSFTSFALFCVFILSYKDSKGAWAALLILFFLSLSTPPHPHPPPGSSTPGGE